MSIDSFDELAREMWDLKRRRLVPLTRILETEDYVMVEADLPFVRKGDIRLRLVKGGLEIKASLKRCISFERWGTVQRNCEFRSFHKIVLLPAPIITEGIRATFKKGVLRVELKKRKEKEYKIPIK